MNAASLVFHFSRTYNVIMRLTEGVTHAESVMTFPFGGNTLNWSFGHVTTARLNILRMLGDTHEYWTPGAIERYRGGTANVTGDAPDVVRIEQIREVFSCIHPPLIERLNTLTPEYLASPFPRPGHPFSVMTALMGSAAHEAYHAGQIEFGRMLAGKPAVPGYE